MVGFPVPWWRVFLGGDTGTIILCVCRKQDYGWRRLEEQLVLCREALYLCFHYFLSFLEMEISLGEEIDQITMLESYQLSLPPMENTGRRLCEIILRMWDTLHTDSRIWARGPSQAGIFLEAMVPLKYWAWLEKLDHKTLKVLTHLHYQSKVSTSWSTKI